MNALLGTTGLLRFGPHTIEGPHAQGGGGNLLNAFADHSPFGLLARCVIDAHILLAAPVYLTITRRSLAACAAMCGRPSLPRRLESTYARRVVVGGLLVGAILSAAAFVPAISYVVSISGAVFGVSLGLALPAALFARAHRLSAQQQERAAAERWSLLQQHFASTDGDEPFCSPARAAALFIAVVGMLEIVLSVTLTVKSWV